MPDTLDLLKLLKLAIQNGISDIHLKPGRPPILRRGASVDLVGPKGLPVLSSRDITELVADVMEDRHYDILKKNGEVDLGWGDPSIGRLRINLFKSRAGNQAVMRVIPARIPSIAELNLPDVVEKLANERRGLILVTGAAGQGKSTTLAAIADQINKTRSAHIITIEDPIEYWIEDRRSVVTQRQVGTDTSSFLSGLRAALRQDPDVIIVGEMRDRDTIETALLAAETGHLVLSTLHTIDAVETVNRVVSVFSGEEKEHARLLLASVITSVISQRLIPRADGKGRVPAVEIMLGTPRIRDLLRTPDGVDQLRDAIAKGHKQYGMQTFDQSLLQLYQQRLITYEEALIHSTNPSDFALKVKGFH